ncbi:MAG TPA: response regulator [Gemmata sp.]|nr:response regulator [Gemmata sp.]
MGRNRGECWTPEVEGAVAQLQEEPGVLVIDDEHLVRIMVRSGLERNGFRVWLAGSGLEAIELYKKLHPQISILLLDVRMADMSGPQVLDALRQINPAVPACFMTGDMGSYSSEELMRNGAARVIDKPFLLSDLARILKQVVNGHGEVQPHYSDGHLG